MRPSVRDQNAPAGRFEPKRHILICSSENTEPGSAVRGDDRRDLNRFSAGGGFVSSVAWAPASSSQVWVITVTR